MLAQIQAMFAVVDLGKINWNQFLEKYLEIAMSIIGKVIVSFLIIAIGFKLIKILIKLLKTTLEKAEIDYGVISFSCSFIRIGLRCIVIFMAVAHMGVEVSSFIALLGSAGVAVGLALQGTLSNVAGTTSQFNIPLAVYHFLHNFFKIMRIFHKTPIAFTPIDNLL